MIEGWDWVFCVSSENNLMLREQKFCYFVSINQQHAGQGISAVLWFKLFLVCESRSGVHILKDFQLLGGEQYFCFDFCFGVVKL